MLNDKGAVGLDEEAFPVGGKSESSTGIAERENVIEGESKKWLDQPVLVLSGPSGSGKTTIVHRLLKECPVPLVKAISATTRPPRAREVHGDHYYFLTPEEFQQKRLAGEFLEFAEVHKSGTWYGTLRSEIQRAADSGAWAFLEIDVQGARSVLAKYPGAVTIFLQTPSLQVYEQRLRSRGTDDEQAIQQRLSTARRELELVGEYKYQVVNENLDQAVAEIIEILKKEESLRHA